MNVLLIGSGGREHALAWKIAQSPKLDQLWSLPGNPGTAQYGTNLSVDLHGQAALSRLADEKHIDLVVIGPEQPLADGMADVFANAGVPVFGPSQRAARIEASKSFAKQFMRRHAIPTAGFQTFTDYEAASAAVAALPAQSYVIKASGLAAGKGVYLPETSAEMEEILRALLVDHSLGESGEEVLVEERISGPEVSVLAFSDGTHVALMPPAQDHKRLLEGDRGPNTGGMGAFAPSPLCPPELLAEVERTIIQPTVDGLRQEDMPFRGVLYAGLMLTPDGPSVLEFNCRFGDPETQVILPLLDGDLLEIMYACATGNLPGAASELHWKQAAAAVIVLASPGYPDDYPRGLPIHGLDDLPPGVHAFHAGTAVLDGRLVTAGGRVLGITATGSGLEQALAAAYGGVERVSFSGMHYRGDIGQSLLAEGARSHQAHQGVSQTRPAPSAYAAAGVSIDAGVQAVERMRSSVRSTFTPQVLSDLGAFGGLFSAARLTGMRDPVLVATTDGVGTKVILAAECGRWESVGKDIVNHCINDLLVQGAMPLFFLDYFGTDRLDPAVAAQVVEGISAACRDARIALLGGETAEMPGVYAQGRFDVVGSMVGVVERSAILPRNDVRPGDALLGLPSSGPHTNGFSLIRKAVAGRSLDEALPELGACLADALLEPHRSYLEWLRPLLWEESGAWRSPGAPLKALAHITGGGFLDNIPRVLPEGCGARIHAGAWQVPPVFSLIQDWAGVAEVEMYRVFNMGLGMVAVVANAEANAVAALLGHGARLIGEVTAEPGVRIE